MTASVTGNKIKTIIRVCQMISRMSQGNPDIARSETLYYEMLSGYYQRILRAKDEGKTLAAHTVFFPVEILYAMDIVPMHTEATTWMIAMFLGDCAEMLSAGAGLGLAAEICTAHRGVPGAFITGVLPRPDIILWSNMVCDNTAKSGELFMELNHCSGFFLDRPFKDSKEEKRYLVGEMEDMIRFLEEQTGRRMDWARLSRTVAGVARHLELTREINELRKNVPTPFANRGFMQLISADYLCPGQPEAIRYLEALRDDLKQMVARGKGAVPRERFRLMTLFLPPMHLSAFMEEFSQQTGAVSVIEPFFTLWGEGNLDPDHPLESLVEKTYMTPEMRMYGPLDDRALNAIKQSAREYKVDGAIYYADINCRQSCAAIKLFKDTLNKLDVPMLTVDIDVVDPTATSKEEVKEKLERFFELLEDR